jgi:hypothetical protein
MSDFLYKNPITPEQLNGAQSVSRTETFGTNFSILGIGGFMEVYNITDLYFTIPPATTGPIELSGNTIPINFLKGSGTPFSPDVLTLNSDNISSGRRRLGMLVYVYETDQVYQYQIDNFYSLWSAATGSTGVGGNTVVFSDFGTTVKNNSVAGQNFINAWTANTVDGVSGNVTTNSVWKKYYGSNLSITGGTYDSFTGTLNLVNVTGGTVPITGISGGGGGGGITGGTFIYSAQTLELYSSGGTISITGFSDVYVTGGTYSAGTITFTNNSGGTFVVTGIPTGGGGVSGDYLPLSGGTVSGNTIFTSGLTANTLNITGNTFLENTSGTSFYTDYIDFNNSLTPLPTDIEGRMYWDDDNGTVSLGMHDGQVVQQIGLEQYYYIKNQSGATIQNGRVVRAAGTLGASGRILGEYMIANGTIPPKFTLGIATEDILNGDDGYVTEFGLVRGLNTTGSVYGETWTAGTILYVSSTIQGGLTSIEPQPPNLRIEMAIVINAATNGSIFVRPNRYPYLYDIQQINYSAGTENNFDILQWSGNSWNKTNQPFFNGLTATTISATTYQNLPSFNYVQITGTTQFSAGTNNNLNFSGININIVSGANNTLIFSAGTGGGGGGTTVTGGTYSAGTLTINSSDSSSVSITGFPSSTYFGVSVDGSGGVITTGQKGYVKIPYNFTITAWTIIGTPSGTLIFDVWKANNTLPTVANTIITGGTKPTLSGTTLANSSSVSGWNVNGLANDIIGWNVDSATTVTNAVLQIYVTRIN